MKQWRVTNAVCRYEVDPLRWSRHVNDQAIVIGWAGYDAKVGFLPPEHFLVLEFRDALWDACRGGELARCGPDGKLIVRLKEDAEGFALEHVLVTLEHPEALPVLVLAERVNGEAVIETAQRESTRALQRHPEINMMFAMDDESLQGGLLAARELGRSERGIIAVGFGLAGDEAKHHPLLHADAWKASLSMFPEWAGARCVDQCVRLLNNQHVPVHEVVPTICVSRDMMTTYFTEHEGRWYPNF